MLFCSLVIGVGISRVAALNPVWVAPAVILALVFVWRRTWISLVVVILFGLSCGMWRGSVYMHRLSQYDALQFWKISVTAVAMDDGVYNKNQQIEFYANNIETDAGQALTGKILVSGFGLNTVFQGDELRISGKLYPGFGSYQGRMSFSQISLVSHHENIITSAKRKFSTGMITALPEPEGSFSLGLLVGQRATLPNETKQDLLMVGLTHIIAVSGYNLTIILRASKNIFSKYSKRLATLFAVGLIITFLLLTGLSASIVRAAIVSMLSIFAAYYGRQFKALNLIMLAAAITALANPVYLWSDASWYLSFLAFFGVMVLAPAVALRIHPKLRDHLLIMVAIESVCAEIMTLPYVLHQFGQMSLIGLLANVLVVVLIPLAMVLGLIAGLAGMIVPSICGWFAWPAKILLTYMLDIAHALASLPHIFLQHLALTTWQMLVLYLVSFGLCTALWFKNKQESGKITDRIF